MRDAEGKKIEIAGPHVKVEELVKLIPARAFKSVKVDEKEYWYFALNLSIPDLGKVRLVISYSDASLEGTYAVIVTNRTDWSAKKIIESYLQRWPIETFYQDSKGHLGLDEYRMRGAEAAEKTLVSGLRSLLSITSGLSGSVTEETSAAASAYKNYWRSLSATRTSIA